MKKMTILFAAGLITASTFVFAANGNMNQMGNMPMGDQSMPMMGNPNMPMNMNGSQRSGIGNRHMMNMMQQKQAMMKAHMTKMETHLANI